MKKVHAVLFDMDDTLLDWSGVTMSMGEMIHPHVEGIRQFLANAGWPVPDSDAFMDCYRQTIKQCWREAKEDFSAVHFASALQRMFCQLSLDVPDTLMPDILQAFDWQPFPGVVPFADCFQVLDTLKNAGYKLGIITNAMYPMWMRDIELRLYDLIDYFPVRVSSGDCGYMKPHPAIYHHALAQMAVEPETAVFVGDRPENDIAGANAVGMISVQMAPPYLNRPNPNQITAHYTITQLTDLLPILAALEQNE